MAESQLPAHRSATLRADCGSCVGLCCVALAFGRSPEFAFDKAAGDPCTHLQDDYRCGIHPVLRERGFKGCTAFDCLGAGQKVTQLTFGGVSWREAPGSREQMFVAFQVMRPLHELLWYLAEAMALPPARPLYDDLRRAYDEIEQLTTRDADELLTSDVGAQRDRVKGMLARASELVRAEVPPRVKATRRFSAGADLIGAKLAGQDLRGLDLRGSLLVAADLRRADLRTADLIGADLRDADLSGADLSTSLFLTPFQVNAARGDASTRLPRSLTAPAHWAA